MLTDITIRKLLASPPPKRVEHAAGKVASLFFITQPSGATSWALRYSGRRRNAQVDARKLPLSRITLIEAALSTCFHRSIWAFVKPSLSRTKPKMVTIARLPRAVPPQWQAQVGSFRR
jgi:hypothetical protein